MILCRNLIAASCVMFITGMASIHLVNMSIVMNKNLNPPGALGEICTMSISHIAKGRRDRSAEEDLHVSLSATGRTGSHYTW
jgi:hypothetical protein